MFTCKQVSNLLSQGDYDKLSPIRKFWFRLHLKLCVFCGRFNRQVIETQNMCRCYKQHETDLEHIRPKLDEVKKEHLKRLLAEQSKDTAGAG